MRRELRDGDGDAVLETEDEGAASVLRSSPSILPWCLAAFAIAARAVILRATHSTTEDFYITLRYAENLARGAGFVYNPGEHVLGTTTPLYTLLLALAAALHLDAAAIGKGLNILADGATCALIALLLAALGRPRTGWLAALLYATASAPVSISIGGMETALVTCTGLAAIYAYVRHRSRAMWLALAALFLLRIDGLLLAVVLAIGSIPYSVFRIQNSKRNTQNSKLNTQYSILNAFGRDALLSLLLVLPWIVFATAYFGSPIPTSAWAKVVVYHRVRQETQPNLPEFRTQFFGGLAQKALLAAFLTGAVAAWRAHRALRAPLVWLALYYAIMLFSKVPAFGWYFVPPLPIYYAVAALGVGSLGRWVVGSLGKSPPITQSLHYPITLCLLALPLVWHLRAVTADIRRAQALEDTVRRPCGEWLAAHTAPDARVLLEPIGYIGYFSRRPVLDIIGLVSPEALPSYRNAVPNPLADIVQRFRPTLLLLRQEERAQLEAYTRATGRALLDSDYRFVRAFPDERTGPAFFLYRAVSGKQQLHHDRRK